MAQQPKTDRTLTAADFARETPIVNLADARVRLRSRLSSNPSRELLAGELGAAHLLLDQGLSTEAEFWLTSLIKAARLEPQILAQARCSLSVALEQQGRYGEALEAVKMYESPVSQEGFDADVALALRVQLSIAYNYTDDFPKAIALLNLALPDLLDSGSEAQQGTLYLALARVYRSINEYPISRDYAQKALDCFRHTGDWRGLTESYFATAITDTMEGNYTGALENYQQALKLIGNHPATYILGKIYNNLSGICWFLRRPDEGIRYLEKAIGLYERAEHKSSAADGYNNLGINLVLVGDWKRAQAALERALTFAREVNDSGARASMVLDALGELSMLRGDLEESQTYLKEALEHSLRCGNKWYEAQVRRTLGRCRLASDDVESALNEAHAAFALGEKIGDQHGISESRLLLAESHLRKGETESCAAELQQITERSADSVIGLVISGEAQRISGQLARTRGDAMMAIHHLGRSVTLFEMLGDRYKTAVANYELGCAYATTKTARASELLTRAAETFRELGARLALARAEQSRLALDDKAPAHAGVEQSLSQLSTLRLAEASASREFLLRELGAIIYQETGAQKVLIFEPEDVGEMKTVVAHGATSTIAKGLTQALQNAVSEQARRRFVVEHDAAVIELQVTNAQPATLLISPKSATALADGTPVDSLIRIAEMGLELCAFRETARTRPDAKHRKATIDQSVMPGFIHSSPAMAHLVSEMHKIRSSDVTVLITGESGTGKELVARGVHALSARREKVFVPFNCTAIPKELSEGYLFGYRKGAYTGATSDSPGVIRSAAGGTLFLDEIGDLPLDLQPKLLRFLQEGEIQPLGETRPMKVDVRIIAATNGDLEKMVAEGRFREDLYYRLNVIRLRVPPLRERRSEIPNIVNYYINHYAEKFNRKDIEITPQTIDLLIVCEWQGNVRQLCNELQRVVARAEDSTLITPDQLSPELQRIAAPPATANAFASVTQLNPPATTHNIATQGMSLSVAVEELERQMISETMRKHNNNISRAARELGLTRRGLQLKLGRYALSASA